MLVRFIDLFFFFSFQNIRKKNVYIDEKKLKCYLQFYFDGLGIHPLPFWVTISIFRFALWLDSLFKFIAI
jgi:hypothetical protein